MSTETTSKKSLDLNFDVITDLSDGLEAMKKDKQDFLPVEGEAEPAWEQELLEKVSNSLLESLVQAGEELATTMEDKMKAFVTELAQKEERVDEHQKLKEEKAQEHHGKAAKPSKLE